MAPYLSSRFATVFIAFAFLILLFGCTGGSSPTPEPPQPQPNLSNSNTTIVVGNQQNQTNEQNNQGKNDTPIISPIEFEYKSTPTDSINIYIANVSGTDNAGAVLVKKGDLDVLFDSGSTEGAGRLLDFLRASGVDDIDLYVSTTVDPNNYGGLDTVLKNYKVENFWYTGKTYSDKDYESLLEKVKQKVPRTKIIKGGDSVDLNGIKFEFFNPTTFLEDPFDDAIVTKVSDRNFSMLLTSSAYYAGLSQARLNYGDKLKSRVMTAPFYGQGHGVFNANIFVQTVAPEEVVFYGKELNFRLDNSRDAFIKSLGQNNLKPKIYEEYHATTVITSNGLDYSVSSSK